MKPINQTKLHVKDEINGNCMAACFASYFNLSINNIPPFEDMDDWVTDLLCWIDELGYDIHTSDTDLFFEENFDDYYFATGVSPRDKTIKHMVIYKNGKLYHDPHPSKSGIIGLPTSFWYFIKLK